MACKQKNANEFLVIRARGRGRESNCFINPIQTGLFWISSDRGRGIAMKSITMKHTRNIVCPKIYLFIYVTWDDDVTSRRNCIMMSKQPPSWIRNLGFQNFFLNVRKPPKITEKYLTLATL